MNLQHVITALAKNCSCLKTKYLQHGVIYNKKAPEESNETQRDESLIPLIIKVNLFICLQNH